MHSCVTRTYEDVTWHGISGEEIGKRENIGPAIAIAIANELSAIRAASVRIGSNPIYSHTSTFVYVFSFPACEAGDWERRERNRWRAEGPTRRRRIAFGCSNAEFNRVDWFHGKNSANMHAYISVPGSPSPFAQRRKISPIHPCNCAKSNCTEANQVSLDVSINVYLAIAFPYSHIA